MRLLLLCLFAITVFIELPVPTVANPDGFININCGASANQTEGDDDLLWVSDSPFIKAKSRQIYTLSNDSIYLPYRSVSYFTDPLQKKYCYLLQVRPGMRYLVRTVFHYHSHLQSELSLASIFDLLIGGVKWETLNLDLSDTYVDSYEIILTTKIDKLSLCLARNSQTQSGRYVFISTIELRQLDSHMYTTRNARFDKISLSLISRSNFGGEFVSYKKNKLDPYDRWWGFYVPEIGMDRLNINYSLGTVLPNHVPQNVLQTAVSAKEIKDMDISDAFADVDTPVSPGSYYFVFYFCNINLRTNISFQVHINGEETGRVEFKDYLQCKFLDHCLELENTVINVVLKPSKHSASGPFVNGAELYVILGLNDTQLEDVLAIREIADKINVPDDWSGADPCLPSDYPSTGITCSKENPPRVIIVDLTNMGLRGDIPPSIAKLTALTQLLLGNNSLSGPVPDLSPLKSLTTLQLQNNQLEGTIPASLENLSALNQLNLLNNNLTGTLPQRLLRKRGLDVRVDPQNMSAIPTHKRNFWPMGISVVCSLLLVLLVLCTAFIWRHRHRSQPKAEHASADVKDQVEYRTLAIEYTEDHIKAATEKFSTVIGKGSFGSVFYGRISGSDVAVKVLSTDSTQGRLEFHNELTVLSRIHHRNLVNLVGYCRQPVVALVYEYMECGSLKDHLYGRAKQEKPLDWHTRLNIALQAAEGLHYLHHGCNPPIIHRDIKCNNILLDGNMCAKVADFGLSKVLEGSKSYVSTTVKGTIGYMDPEYFESSALTEESDVYSFGVVLLEILSGTSPKDGIVESGRKLVSCGRVADLIDASLGARYNLASAWRVAQVAYDCTEPKSIKRPKMSMVVKELQEVVALQQEEVHLYGSVSITESIPDLPCLR